MHRGGTDTVHHTYCTGDADPVVTGMGSCRPPYKYACAGDADTAVLGPPDHDDAGS
jgi:hypothetical protein